MKKTAAHPEPCMPFEQFEARVERLQARHGVSRAFMTNLHFREELERSVDQLIITLDKRLLAGDVTEEVSREKDTYKRPLNSWEHLKWDFIYWKRMPTWLGRYIGKRWPVKLEEFELTRTVVNKVTRMCPHVAIPDHTHHMRWLFAVKQDLRYDSVNGY